jgi:hypothetical protein
MTSMNAQAKAGPVRRALPMDVDPVNLPVVGRSWYARGANYWLRRIVYTILMGFTLALETALLFGIWVGLGSTGGRIAFVIFESGLTIFTGGYIFKGLSKAGSAQTRSSKVLSKKNAQRAGRSGAVIGTLARLGTFAGALFIAIGCVLTYGLVLVLFLRSFLPRLDVERRAYMDLAAAPSRRRTN